MRAGKISVWEKQKVESFTFYFRSWVCVSAGCSRSKRPQPFIFIRFTFFSSSPHSKFVCVCTCECYIKSIAIDQKRWLLCGIFGAIPLNGRGNDKHFFLSWLFDERLNHFCSVKTMPKNCYLWKRSYDKQIKHFFFHVLCFFIFSSRNFSPTFWRKWVLLWQNRWGILITFHLLFSFFSSGTATEGFACYLRYIAQFFFCSLRLLLQLWLDC